MLILVDHEGGRVHRLPAALMLMFMRVAAPEFGPVALAALRVIGASLLLMPFWAVPLSWILAKILREPGGWKALYGVVSLAGLVLIVSATLMPPFLQQLMGYPVFTTGVVLAPRGAGMMVSMMMVSRLIGRVDAEQLVSARYRGFHALCARIAEAGKKDTSAPSSSSQALNGIR